MPARLLADLHISPKTVAALRSVGYTISRVTDYLPSTFLLALLPTIENELKQGSIISVDEETIRIRPLPIK